MGFRVSGGEFGGLADAFRFAEENERRMTPAPAVNFAEPGGMGAGLATPASAPAAPALPLAPVDDEPTLGGMGGMGAPPAPAAPMGPVETERSVTTQTTRPVARPEEAGIQSGMDALAKEQETRLRAAQGIAEKEAKIGMEAAGAKQAQAEGYAKRIGEIENEEREKDRLAVEQMEADEKAFRGAKIQDYWADKSTGHKVLAGIGMLLGSAAGYQGRTNPAVGVIERAVEQDFQRQKANIDKLEKQYGMSRTKREDIRASFDRQRSQLDAKRIAATDAIIARAEAEAAKLGPSKVGMKFAEEIEKLKSANLERRQKYFEGLRETQGTTTTSKQVTPTSPEQGLTEDQLKAMKTAQELVQGNEDFKGWKEKRGAATRFKAFVDAKADGAALIDFMATGMKQGSFGPEMVEILRQEKLLDKGNELVRKNLEGGVSDTLKAKLLGALQKDEANARKRAKGPIAAAKAIGKTKFNDADYFLGEDQPAEAPAVEEKTTQEMGPDGKPVTIRWRKTAKGWEEME